MANINAYLEAIMEAVYGEDVRGSIHDAIEIINDVSEVVLVTGTDVTSASSSSTGFYNDSLYFNTDTKELWKCIGTDSWQSQGVLKGDQGDPGTPGTDGTDGVGIESIAKTSSSGLVDTYTITMTDGNTTTFTVTNGADGTDGDDGNGIVSITKTSTSGVVDTYTILYTDGTSSTFTVTNGVDGTNGRGITSITKTSTAGLVDTYTITYSDTTTSTFTVTNGVVGNKWYTGTVVSGKSSTPTVFSGSGITYANAGDLYLNISEGAEYHCDTPGDASTATWVYDFTLAGGGSGATVLSDLQDVSLSSLTQGQFLQYDGAEWENITLDYSDVANTPVVDATITSGSTNAVEAQAIYAALANKQDTLTIDTNPTSGSSNPVSSGGVYSGLSGKQDTLSEGTGIDITSNVVSIDADSTPTSGSGKPVTSGGLYTKFGDYYTKTEMDDELDEFTAAVTQSGTTVTFSGLNPSYGYKLFWDDASASGDLAIPKPININKTIDSGTGLMTLVYTIKGGSSGSSQFKLRILK